MSTISDRNSSPTQSTEPERNAPSQLSAYSALEYGSEAGASMVSSSSVTSSHHRGASQRSRVDLGKSLGQQKTIAIDANDDILKQKNATAECDDGITTAPGSRVYIWGTRICVDEVQKLFYSFICDFRADAVDDDENAIQIATGEPVEINLDSPYYIEKLRGIYMCEIPILNLNLGHVRQFSEQLYKMIVAYPDSVIPYLDTTVNDLFLQTYNKILPTNIEIRPYNAEQTKNMRDLNPQDIDQLITTSGMVTRISMLIPEMSRGFFSCSFCNATVENMVDCGRIEEPVSCTNCGNSYCFQLIHNRSVFIDKQVIKLQEIPGDMPSGQTQHTITLFVHGSLVENVHPGDRVSVTGIYRATPIRLNPVQRAVNSVYRTSIDVIHFRKMTQNRLHESSEGFFLTDERVAKVLELSQREDVIERLVKSIAPTIFGHDEIKKGILCLLFGGTRKSDQEGNRVKLRSEINLLLCGDPGTAKSQLLQYVYHLVPRSQFTSGKGSSAVGLSASVTRDSETKSVVLQTGALVLADNGVCCIDEFDKMSDSTRSILHEVMEQQTLSIAKAGIICQLNARASILAAANPIDSKWNEKKNIIENVHLPHTLLSRFDLIFLVLDPQDEEYDRRLAKHLVNFYLEADLEVERQQQLDMNFLRDYIAYAKEKIHPQLTTESSQLLIQKYQSMRQQGSNVGHISAYPRQLESLIRLSEGFAKMRLSNDVAENDVEMAYELHKEALRQSAIDPDTGLVEVNIIATGFSDKHKKKVAMTAELIRQEIEHRKGNFSVTKLFKEMRIANKMLDKESFDDAVKALILEGFILRNADRIRVIGPKD